METLLAVILPDVCWRNRTRHRPIIQLRLPKCLAGAIFTGSLFNTLLNQILFEYFVGFIPRSPILTWLELFHRERIDDNLTSIFEVLDIS